MTTLSPEEQIIMGQTVAKRLAHEIAENIDEAITQAVLMGMIPMEIAPEVKRQTWGELAIDCATRFREHGS